MEISSDTVVLESCDGRGIFTSAPILCLALLAALWASCVVGVVIYRIFLHPLAHLPGPKIAAATFLYEIAWDYFGDGAYLYEIEKMHKKYGWWGPLG